MSLHHISLFLLRYTSPVFLVGGSVRQCLLGKIPEDIDLIVPQQAIVLAQKLAKSFQLKWIILDDSRDIARVFASDMVLDIAAYGQNLTADLSARDLTVNAMACPVSVPWTDSTCMIDKAQLIDPCNGLYDLQNGILRGVAHANFVADPLRLLRLFRFAVTLGFQIDGQTLNWVKQLKESIAQSSPERILAELSKLLSEAQTAKNVVLMCETGLAESLFQHETALLQHRAEILGDFERFYNKSLVQIAVLKTYLNTCLADKRQILFLFKLSLLIRPLPGAVFSTLDLKNRYAFSRAEIDCLLLWEQLGLMLQAVFETPSPVAIMRFFRLGRQHTLGALIRFYLDNSRTFSKAQDAFWWELIKAWENPTDPLAHPVDWIDGRDIMRELEIPAGPKIGRILEYIQAQQALGNLQGRQSALEILRGLSADDF